MQNKSECEKYYKGDTKDFEESSDIICFIRNDGITLSPSPAILGTKDYKKDLMFSITCEKEYVQAVFAITWLFPLFSCFLSILLSLRLLPFFLLYRKMAS